MATSDERREVAERLREYARLRNCYPFEALFVRLNMILWYVAKAAFGDVDVYTYCSVLYTYCSVFARLADLIDLPTCHVVKHETYYGSFGCEEAGELWTLSCGDECINESDFPPSYCPECGARVVDERGSDED